MLKNMLTKQNDLNGWLIIDKPLDMGSTTVVSRLKHALHPDRIGHAGTLDPLATGVLPIALGQATKLIPYVMNGEKVYEFQITWGAETETDDAAGAIVCTSDVRPDPDAVRAVLPRFVGTILQQPPAYSALKINGRRAYDLARQGDTVNLAPRPVRIDELTITAWTPKTADFRVRCGKGTYVRSLGRDIGRALGTRGFISRLRRVQCGPFSATDAVPLNACIEGVCPTLFPLETALDTLPIVHVNATEARRLAQGQRIPARTLVNPLSIPWPDDTVVRVVCETRLIGLARWRGQVVHPYRIFCA